MFTRRIVLALPLLCGAPLRAAPIDDLSAALALCWQARGVRFAPDWIAARIGGRTGAAALLALGGAVTDADGDDQEIVVEIAWEAGMPASPAEPLLARDLAAGLPGLLLSRDGQWWLLIGRTGSQLALRHPMTGERRLLALDHALLMARPVIAGA